MYHREGCHLCEQMVASLQEQQRKHQQVLHFDIEIIDIDEDPKLIRLYDIDVPVVKYQNEVVFYHFFDPEEFERILNTMTSPNSD